MQKKHLVLVGYMASGKTAVGQALHELSHLPWVDVDEYIELTTGMSAAQWIVQKGEIAFRKAEHTAFQSLCQNDQAQIISTGGGTPCYANNGAWLQHPKVFSVYLQTSIPTLMARLQSDDNHRPLAPCPSEQNEATEALAKHLFERIPFYAQAQYTIATDGRTVPELTLDIWTTYQKAVSEACVSSSSASSSQSQV